MTLNWPDVSEEVKVLSVRFVAFCDKLVSICTKLVPKMGLVRLLAPKRLLHRLQVHPVINHHFVLKDALYKVFDSFEARNARGTRVVCTRRARSDRSQGDLGLQKAMDLLFVLLHALSHISQHLVLHLTV